MKFSVELAIFAFFYLLIIILFSNETSAEPRGVQENTGRPKAGEGAGEQQQNNDDEQAYSINITSGKLQEEAPIDSALNKGANSPKIKRQAAQATPESQPKEVNPFADLFQITDPTMRATMASVYGAYKGNDQCSRKAFCMLGNYMKDMPGRDLVFLFMGNYVPAEYSLYYEIFKVAVTYGQNCNVYVCIPESPPPEPIDAASAARPNADAKPKDNSNAQQNPNTMPR